MDAFALDLETGNYTGTTKEATLNPFEGGGQVRIISIDGVPYDMKSKTDHTTVWLYLEKYKNKTLVAHNAWFDLLWLRHQFGYEHPGPIFCTQIASQMLGNGKIWIDNDLAALSDRVLGIKMDKSQQKSNWAMAKLTDEQLEYAAKDTNHLVELAEKLEDYLRRTKLWELFQMEMGLLPVLLDMTMKGVKLDTNAAYELAEQVETEAAEIELSFFGMFNPKAPTQVANALGLENAQADTIKHYYEDSGDELAGRILEYKKLVKKAATLRKQLVGRVDENSRIHPHYTQTYTDTGRLSCRSPNLQNQDSGKDIRKLFVPAKGNVFVIADYAQLEVRVAALIANETNMIKAFKDPDTDLHGTTCRAVFGEPDEMEPERKKRTRTLSKNILFASLFGGGSWNIPKFAFKAGEHVSEEEAEKMQKAFFKAYPKLRAWHRRQGNTGTEYVYSILGRKRYIKRGEGYSARINHPVQGTAADGIKIALIELRKTGIVPVLCVHDEIVVECDEAKAQEIEKVLVEKMVEGMYRATKQDATDPLVPISVESGIGESWAAK